MNKLKLWFLATRPQFFTAIILPILLGAAAARHYTGLFDAALLAASLAAGILYQAGTNVFNDYYDHLNGTDNINRNSMNPFSGGSQMIQKGLMTPRETAVLGTVLVALGSVVGLWVAWQVGWPILALGVAGLFMGFFYSCPPLFFAGKGIGEILVALNFGVLSVAGSYYVQTLSFRWDVIAASLPLSLLIMSVVYSNEFTDFEADKASGKDNLVVRLGPKRGRWGLVAIEGGAYLIIALGAGLGWIKPLALIALVPAVLAWKGTSGIFRDYDGGEKLIPYIPHIIFAHLSTGLLLAIAYAL